MRGFERGDREDLLELFDPGLVEILPAEVGAGSCLVFVQRLAACVEGPRAGDGHDRTPGMRRGPTRLRSTRRAQLLRIAQRLSVVPTTDSAPEALS